MDISSNSSGATQKPPPPPPRPPHQDDADEEDENVKQLKECSAIYLSLQALFPVSLPSSNFIFCFYINNPTVPTCFKEVLYVSRAYSLIVYDTKTRIDAYSVFIEVGLLALSFLP